MYAVWKYIHAGHWICPGNDSRMPIPCNPRIEAAFYRSKSLCEEDKKENRRKASSHTMYCREMADQSWRMLNVAGRQTNWDGTGRIILKTLFSSTKVTSCRRRGWWSWEDWKSLGSHSEQRKLQWPWSPNQRQKDCETTVGSQTTRANAMQQIPACNLTNYRKTSR